MKLLVISGPNLNMLGTREPDIYGYQTLDDLYNMLTETGKEDNSEFNFFQSNHEGDLVDCIQNAYENYDGIIINPAAYTHTSIAIRDALSAVGIPAIEVHLSNVKNREQFRQISYISDVCVKTITGKGFDGYKEAYKFLKDYLINE